LIIQCDELWAFIQKKTDNGYGLPRMSAQEKLPAYILEKNNRKGVKGLRDSLLGVYRQCAVSYTDFRNSYAEIFPSGRHRAVAKNSGKTGYIERLNLAIRQRVSRLVRKTLSFSKNIENHAGAVWNFVHHYNASISG